MAKLHAQRQKEYFKRLKEKGEANSLKKDREQKQKERAALKLNKQKYELVNAKDRQRKKLKKQAILEQATEPTASSPTPFGSIQSFGKASAKAKCSLPKSPKEKRAVITYLVKSLSPNSKKQVYESGRSVDVNLGRPRIPVETKELLTAFLKDQTFCIVNLVKVTLYTVAKMRWVTRYKNPSIICYGHLRSYLSCIMQTVMKAVMKLATTS